MKIGYDGETVILTVDGPKKAKDLRLTDKVITCNVPQNITNIDVRIERDYSTKIEYGDNKSVIVAEYHSIRTNYGFMDVSTIDTRSSVMLVIKDDGKTSLINEYTITPLPPEKRTFITMTVENLHEVITDNGFILHN